MRTDGYSTLKSTAEHVAALCCTVSWGCTYVHKQSEPLSAIYGPILTSISADWCQNRPIKLDDWPKLDPTELD